MPAKTAALSGLGLVAPRYLVFAKLKNTLVVDFKRGGERLSCLLGARVAPESKLFKQSGRICAPKVGRCYTGLLGPYLKIILLSWLFWHRLGLKFVAIAASISMTF